MLNSQITYLGCILDETMSGEPIAYKTIKKINSRLNYLFRAKHFLTPRLIRQLLCKALIQPHFDYVWTVWYPSLIKKLKNKIQTTKNKCVQFCLNLEKIARLSQNEFEKLNWLSISDRFNQCVLLITFKFVNKIRLNYLNEVFMWATESNRTLRNDYRKLKHPFHKTAASQNLFSFLGPSKWKKLFEFKKKLHKIDTFKQNLNKKYLAQLTNQIRL